MLIKYEFADFFKRIAYYFTFTSCHKRFLTFILHSEFDTYFLNIKKFGHMKKAHIKMIWYYLELK